MILHHVVAGSPQAPPLLMSHSLGASHAMWDPQVPELAPHFRVVCCDLRGHGQSAVPPPPYALADLGSDLIALLDHLQIERADLCGLSLGAMASLWLAAHHPRRVHRLIVCSTSALLTPAQAWHDRAAAVRAGGLEAVVDTVVGRWFTPSYAARHPQVVGRMRATFTATSAAGYAGCCQAIAGMDLRSDLAAVRAPTLAIAGADDPATPPEHLARIAAGIPGCRLVVVEDAAHLLNIEQPQKTTDLIIAHLRGQERP